MHGYYNKENDARKNLLPNSLCITFFSFGGSN